MSPEQARAETVDHRSDLFSLGSVMYAMCTGHAPFRAESSYSVLRLITDKDASPDSRDQRPDLLPKIGCTASITPFITTGLTPRLGDLTWKRVSGEPDASTQSNDTNSSKQNQPLDFNGSHSSLYLPKVFGKNPVKIDLAWDSAGGELAFAVELFNKEIQKRFPNHGQPPLTKDELVSCASWNKLHKENSSTVGRLLSAIATRHQLLEGWAIHGDFVELPPKDTPVRAYQIVLKHNVSGEQFIVRQRFVAPLKSLSNTNSQEAESKGIPLSASIKRFNETNFRVDGKKQPPLTEEEVIAAILHQQTRRDEYDVSDSLFERLQSIARTQILPEGATFEVIPKFGTEEETIHTIWSVRVRLVQDEAGREGWTYAFILREQFLSVTHGDAGKINWGNPGANGLQVGVRLSPPLTRYSLGQRIDVELLYRNVLTNPLQATVSNFPRYAVVAKDKLGRQVTVVDPPFEIVGGATVENVGEQPVVRKGMSLKLVDSAVSQFADERLLLVEADQMYRLRFETPNISDGVAERLLSGEIEFSVDEPEEVRAAALTSRNAFPHRAELAHETILIYLAAVKRLDLETSRAIDRNDERVRDKLSAISGSATPNQPESAWVANQSALIAFGPIESHDRELNGKLILYTLAFVDERWFLVDVSIETAASLSIKGELFLKEHPEATRTITRVDDTVKQE
jgi:hypothetical protein